MKCSDIIVEKIDQAEADEVLRNLHAMNDPIAPYFQITRNDPKNKGVDSALRGAELMYKKDQTRKSAALAQKSPRTPRNTKLPNTDTTRPNTQIDIKPHSDRFYGNQYTGSLGKGAQYTPGELGRLLGIKPNSAIGKAISAVNTVSKPLRNIRRAFKLGTELASQRR
jgi:hypothetical protein